MDTSTRHVARAQATVGGAVWPQVAADRDAQGWAVIPRMQSRAMVLPLRQGDAAVIATRQGPVQGTRDVYRVNLRHGVSRVRSGRRHTLGIIFHDAA